MCLPEIPIRRQIFASGNGTRSGKWMKMDEKTMDKKFRNKAW
jgi:hypothetical protein